LLIGNSRSKTNACERLTFWASGAEEVRDLDELLAQLQSLLDRATKEQRLAVFRSLRKEFHVHPLEGEWNTSAEAILEAISRSADITHRGIRGILAEASFFTAVLPRLLANGWKDLSSAGEDRFDAKIEDTVGGARIQIKLQRRKNGQPMMGTDAPKSAGFAADVFVVETQKTRAGKRGDTETRPYRFGDFDILAVSLSPSTRNWDDFVFTVGDWLIPDPKDPGLIFKYQPVPPAPNAEWTSDLIECIAWHRSGIKKQIRTTR
jgi:hypothetical protein